MAFSSPVSTCHGFAGPGPQAADAAPNFPFPVSPSPPFLADPREAGVSAPLDIKLMRVPIAPLYCTHDVGCPAAPLPPPPPRPGPAPKPEPSFWNIFKLSTRWIRQPSGIKSCRPIEVDDHLESLKIEPTIPIGTVLMTAFMGP